MLQPRTSLLRFSAVVAFFTSQCSIVRGRALLSRNKLQGSLESAKGQPSQPPPSKRPIVSDVDAEHWLEQALWGPEGAKQWRHRSLLGTHRLRLDGIEKIHMLPKLKTRHQRKANRTHAKHFDDDDSGEEGSKEDDEDDDQDMEDTGDDQEDVLSAGLRSTAMAKQRALQERRAKKAKARIRREELLRNLLSHESVKQREARRVREAAHARARQRSGRATSDVNVMLQQVLEELDQERHRCETYFKTAEIEREVAKDASVEDQEQVARMQSDLLAYEGDLRDIEHQLLQLSEEMRAHKARCQTDLVDLRAEMAALVEDANTTQILMGLSPCPQGSAAVLLQCQHPATGKPYMTSRHQGLQKIMAQLSSHTARRSLQHSLKTLSRSSRHKKHHRVYTSFLQRVVRHHRSRSHRHEHNAHQSSKCTATTADCKAVVSALILMMADVYDKQHTTQVSIDEVVRGCDAETADLERETSHLLGRREMISLHVTQTLSVKGTLQSEASGRLQDYDRFNRGLVDVRKECDGSIKQYEGQVCDLRRSRKSIFETNGVTVSAAALQDCEVSPWSPAEGCSEECGGGVQLMIRTIVVPPGAKGVPCPALNTSRSCNLQPCAVNCKVAEWTPWSQCSAICGGGIRQRFRQIDTPAQNGGQCLYSMAQLEACNAHPCQPDCVLAAYSEWSGCSRACNGGYNRRTRAIAVPKQGNALCPTEEQRNEFRKCDLLKCPAVASGKTLECSGSVDVTFVLDGSSSVGDQDFEFSKTFVNSIIKALRLGSAGRAGLILVGGPTSWTAFEQCKLEASTSSTSALEKCNVALKQSLTADEATMTTAMSSLEKAGGPAYMSAAMSLAAQEAEFTRDDATGIVIVVGHARPLSEARTGELTKRVREKARLMWMVVGGSEFDKDPTTGSRVLSAQKAAAWASTPTSDNVFEAKDYTELNLASKVSEVISAICPSVVGLNYVASHPLPCADQGGTVITTEAACQKAASNIGSCKSFETGSFPNQPGCFANVDGTNKTKCQWNTNTNAKDFVDGTLPICVAP